MPLQTRIRPEYDPALRLRAVGGGYLRELERSTSAGRALNEGRSGEGRPAPGPEGIEIARDLPVTSLPILATANDARELVRFFKKRPNGVTVIEAMNAEPRRIFDARKIAAYEFWGLLRRENDRLNLTELGRELADALEPECGMYRNILVPVDGSPTSLRGLREAIQIARLSGGRIKLLHVVDEVSFMTSLEAGVALTTNRVGAMFGLFFSDEKVDTYAQAVACDTAAFNRFFHAMLERGVYLAPSAFEAGFMSSAHDDAVIERTLVAAREAFRAVKA